MVDDSDIKYIIDDLCLVLEHHKKEEKYELCKSINDIITALSEFVNGERTYDDIVDLLYEVCIVRYMIYRLVVVEGEQFVAFILPNMTCLYFWIDSLKDNSDDWAELQGKYDHQTETVEADVLEILKNSREK